MQPCFSISLWICLLLSLPWTSRLPESRVGVCLLVTPGSVPGSGLGADLRAQPFLPASELPRDLSLPTMTFPSRRPLARGGAGSWVSGSGSQGRAMGGAGLTLGGDR